MSEQKYRVAPPGFTRDQWDEFQENGMLVVEDALTDEECDRYIEMIDVAAARSEKYDPAKFFGPNNIVERYPEFAELIDHPRHIGFMHDVYGELLKLHISQFFLRPRDTSRNKVASRWRARFALWRFFTGLAHANQSGVLADRSSRAGYGEFCLYARQSQGTVF